MIKEIHGGNIYKYDNEMYDFSANLNPLGMPKVCRRAIVENVDRYESYPDPFNRELKKAVSEFWNLPESFFCFGNGAADIIFRMVLALKPKKALITAPTFSEYEEALRVVGCEVSNLILNEDEDFAIDKDRVISMITEDIDMIFICNPNNPTGEAVLREDMIEIAKAAESVGAILVCDQCFSEFMDEEEKFSIIPDLPKLKNTVILKAFTKIYAMAGLRLGFSMCANSEITEKIEETLQPWSVSTVASKAGCAALTEKGFVQKTKDYVKKERMYLSRELEKLGIKVYSSKANYIFFRSEKELSAPLLKYRILVRSCKNYPGLDKRYYRIAVRTKEENEYFIRSLTEVLSENQI